MKQFCQLTMPQRLKAALAVHSRRPTPIAMRLLGLLVCIGALTLGGCGGETDCNDLRTCPSTKATEAGSDGARDSGSDTTRETATDAPHNVDALLDGDASFDVEALPDADASPEADSPRDAGPDMDASAPDALGDTKPRVRSFAVGHAAEYVVSGLCCTLLNGAVRFINTGDVPLDMSTLEAEATPVNPPSGVTVSMTPHPNALLLPPGYTSGLLAESVSVLLQTQIPEPAIEDRHNYLDLRILGLPPDGPFDFTVNVTVHVDRVKADFAIRVRYQQNVRAYTLGRRTNSQSLVEQ
jgi:hypothetical protein